MPEYDMIIRNGTIVDGTGRLPAYRGDVAIKQGKIAMISGRIRASALQELDATGCIIAPGAIDLHTHYDLQLNWEPYSGSQLDVLHISTMGKPSSGVLRRNQVESLCNGLI
jgi:N-acyl-D-aspartate/D-glutamate deacylase